MTSGKETLVQTIGLTKRYGDLTAVDNLNLEVEEGSIFGLLGPNGAGKTTTILMILGLTEPSSGKALVAGHDATREPLAVKSMVGYLPDNVGFYAELTGRENLRYTAALNGIGGSEAERRIDSALERVGLTSAADRRAGEYSRGMKQRLGIADVLVKDPRLIIMDEPTLGIDPEGVRELLGLIRSLAREDGRTILISSHLLHQVQQVCDRVGIFVGGRLMATGSVDELGEKLLGGELLQTELIAEPGGETLEDTCRALEGVREVRREGDVIVILSEGDIRGSLVRTLSEKGFTLLHLRLRGFTLDDIYQKYFQKEGRYAAAS